MSFNTRYIFVALLALAPYWAFAKGAPIVFHVKDQSARKAALQINRPNVLACMKSADDSSVLVQSGHSALSWNLDALETALISTNGPKEQPLEEIQIEAKAKDLDAALAGAWHNVVIVCKTENNRLQQVSIHSR